LVICIIDARGSKSCIVGIRVSCDLKLCYEYVIREKDSEPWEEKMAGFVVRAG
jgi:hypothetical protein